MKEHEAVQAITILSAYFPAASMPEETYALWAKAIREEDFSDALDAAEELGGSVRRLPSLAEFRAVIRDMRINRLQLAEASGTLALPSDEEVAVPAPRASVSLEDFLRTHPDMKDRVRKAGWWGETVKKLESA